MKSQIGMKQKENFFFENVSTIVKISKVIYSIDPEHEGKFI